MNRHASGPILRRGRVVTAASLLAALLAGPRPTVAAEIAPRGVGFRVPGNVRAWGPFSFGMAPGEVERAALAAGGRIVAARAAAFGQPVAYHRPDWVNGGKHSRSEPVLVWFEGRRLSRVTVMLFRLDLRSTEAWLKAHRTAVASRGAPRGAGMIRNTPRGSDGPGQRAGDADDVLWATEVQQSRSRAIIETAWEAPQSAMQAGADETCIRTMTFLPTS